MSATASNTFSQWRAVPARVAELLPRVIAVKQAHTQAALAADLIGTTYATWLPESDSVRVYGPDGANVSPRQRTKYAEKLARNCEFVPVAQPDWAQEILIKRAGIPYIAPTYDYLQKAMGGATPLTNALLIGLTAGGLGYGAGALAENLFPEKYVERGRLRKVLGAAGALSGLGYGALAAGVNARAMDKPYWHGWVIPNDATPTHKPPQVKTGAMLDPDVYGNTGLFGPSIDVSSMNNAIWRDTQKGFVNGFAQHTPPAYAATASGLMSGISTGVGSPIIKPVDVVNSIASAGVGLATATVAGKALSALAGLTPAAQEKIQDIGIWGGMMHAIVPAIMGFR